LTACGYCMDMHAALTAVFAKNAAFQAIIVARLNVR
jgi:AhpD family alkylhydroperoxidase